MGNDTDRGVLISLDTALVVAAQWEGERHGRNTAEQVTHWARVGRELDMSTNLDRAGINSVLDGTRQYDTLGVAGQAVVRATWDERIEERLTNLDITDILGT